MDYFQIIDWATDTIITVIGISVLFISITAIVSCFCKTSVGKQNVKLVAMIGYFLFLVITLFFPSSLDVILKVSILAIMYGGGIVLIVRILFWFVFEAKKSMELARTEDELRKKTEEQCRRCELYEECAEYKPNCPYYVETDMEAD